MPAARRDETSVPFHCLTFVARPDRLLTTVPFGTAKERKRMRTTTKIALVALALAGGSLAVTGQPALADNVTVGVSPGGFAFGYSDGYWDRNHAWHAWENKEQAARFREENRDHYYEWKHDRDPDQGWRSERWWDRH
jgi:hypothetical protein